MYANMQNGLTDIVGGCVCSSAAKPFCVESAWDKSFCVNEMSNNQFVENLTVPNTRMIFTPGNVQFVQMSVISHFVYSRTSHTSCDTCTRTCRHTRIFVTRGINDVTGCFIAVPAVTTTIAAEAGAAAATNDCNCDDTYFYGNAGTLWRHWGFRSVRATQSYSVKVTR